MPALSLIDESKAQGQVRELYIRIKDSLGLSHVPNIFQAMAHTPAFLADMLDNHVKVMSDGTLDRKTKEMIALAVSAVSGCDYCVSVHATIGKKIGLTEPQIAETLALASIMSSHNQFQKFKDHSGDDSFKPMRIGLSETLLKQKSLSDLQAELIYVCVSTVNTCHTCIRYHVNRAKQAGATPQQFAEAAAVMNLIIVYNNFVKAIGLDIDIR